MKKRTSKRSIYQSLSSEIKKQETKIRREEKINIGETIRQLRVEKQLSGVSLCRQAGDLDPRTLTAIEKGRIVNPAIATLQSLARGLGVTVSDLFRQAERKLDRLCCEGQPRGVYQVDFKQHGLRIVSLTPLIRNFFCGKFILAGKKRIEHTFFEHAQPFYVSALIGRVEITVEGQPFELKEGRNLFFNGALEHSFYNPRHKEVTLLLVTAPSFL